MKVSVSVGFVLEVPGGKDRDELGQEIRSQIVEAFHPERVHVSVFLPRPAGSERSPIGTLDLHDAVAKGGKTRIDPKNTNPRPA